ncbi:tRNA pseudouridine(38-40) synthase TruA [Halonotius terrestris]|uniref:tRNA pseudouridine synthase A n=1 Tax=Halonotius terrestris TaxID=2487750 RepID=A0A8J8P8D0_9EURY|nr:tRNA pseudouridine(38-40) synthase TruA [Halonotius terrestris]TQQ80884.1 tRNA pseudouridine(38-40) synthase TruA [Halonotius terrestris]
MRAFRLAYDGRPFYGFQRQPSVPTVEGALFDALRELSILPPEADKPTGYAAAGRTDAGVSAVAQTVAFECPEWLSPRALNSELPATIRAWASADVGDDFHATHDAARREYVYHLYAPEEVGDDGPTPDGRTLDDRSTIDDDRAADAVAALSGRHDFHNLTPDDTGTERDITASIDRDGDVLALTVAAGGFPRHFVRRFVAVVQAVASGTKSLAWIERLLGDEAVDPRPPTASPEPLVLSAVEYSGVDFERDQQAAASGVDAFGERALDAFVGYRVTASIADRLAESSPAGFRDEPEDKL